MFVIRMNRATIVLSTNSKVQSNMSKMIYHNASKITIGMPYFKEIKRLAFILPLSGNMKGAPTLRLYLSLVLVFAV